MSIIADQQAKIKEDIKEAFFSSGNHVLRPVVQCLNEVYPLAKRKQNNPLFDQAIFDEHDEKFRRARNHLYEQRNLVQRKWLPRYIIKVGPVVDTIATDELRSVIVEGALNRLYEMLGAYLPMLVPVEKAKPLLTVITSVYDLQAKNLARTMEKYAATFAPGVISIAQEFE